MAVTCEEWTGPSGRSPYQQCGHGPWAQIPGGPQRQEHGSGVDKNVVFLRTKHNFSRVNFPMFTDGCKYWVGFTGITSTYQDCPFKAVMFSKERNLFNAIGNLLWLGLGPFLVFVWPHSLLLTSHLTTRLKRTSPNFNSPPRQHLFDVVYFDAEIASWQDKNNILILLNMNKNIHILKFMCDACTDWMYLHFYLFIFTTVLIVLLLFSLDYV